MACQTSFRKFRTFTRGHPGISRLRTPSPGQPSPGDIPASLDAGHPRLVQDCSAPERVMQNQKTLKGRIENINQQSCLTLSSCQSCFVQGHNELCPNHKTLPPLELLVTMSQFHKTNNDCIHMRDECTVCFVLGEATDASLGKLGTLPTEAHMPRLPIKI